MIAMVVVCDFLYAYSAEAVSCLTLAKTIINMFVYNTLHGMTMPRLELIVRMSRNFASEDPLIG